jgi:hypothetical protein
MVLFVAVADGACGGAQQSQGTTAGDFGGDVGLREPGEDGRRCPADAAYIEESLDTSGDNVADVRRVYRVEGEGNQQMRLLVCRELDLNHDGRKDIFRFYNEEGRPMRELTDADFDGSIDSIAYYENGRMVKQEADRNSDGNADEIRHFTKGKLSRVDRDDNYDGEIDVWEHWEEERLRRIGYDINRDKVADFWHRAPPRPEDGEDSPPAEEDEADEEEGSEE